MYCFRMCFNIQCLVISKDNISYKGSKNNFCAWSPLHFASPVGSHPCGPLWVLAKSVSLPESIQFSTLQ